MNHTAYVGRHDRHPADTYEQILERDSRPVPDYLREGRVPEVGVEPVAVDRYFDRRFFEKEARHMWSRVWQMACREEDIPNVGDYVLYDILGKSLIVSRSAPGRIQAFYNSCLHRGRKLVTLNGCKQEFKCPYHGLAWRNDGTFKDNPIGWDFPQWEGKDLTLPQAKVDTWGGFVFINLDLNARPLIEYIKPLADDFERFDFPNRYRAAWVQKKVRCNWKATAEAFMESHHSVTTHPQILPGLGDANSQYDLPNDHVSRHFSASGVSSPFLPPLSEKEIFEYMTGQGRGGRRPLGEGLTPKLPDGLTARRELADLARQGLAQETGHDYTHAADAEMLDALLYNVFPNISLWAGYPSNLVYRWRPNGLDTESAIMDVMILKPCPKDQPRPAPAQPLELGLDDPWSEAAGVIGGLSVIFDQDMGNLPYVHEGLKSSGNGFVHFARYSEMRIRHFHKMIDRYLAEGAARTGEVF